MSEEKKETKKPTRSKPKREKRKEVKLVSHQGESALVEWYDGKYHRVYIPVEEFDFEKKTVVENVLSAGVPYGVDWSQMDLAIDLNDLDVELKKRGIWTLEDLNNNPQKANAAINRTLGVMRRQLLNVAEKKEA